MQYKGFTIHRSKSQAVVNFNGKAYSFKLLRQAKSFIDNIA